MRLRHIRRYPSLCTCHPPRPPEVLFPEVGLIAFVCLRAMRRRG